MDKFIKFNDGVFNTRHIVSMTKTKRNFDPQYAIVLHVTGDFERQYFYDESERDTVFNQLSRELLNDF